MVSDQVSSIFWLSHSDLHEERVTAVLGYISSMVAGVEPFNQSANGQRSNRENLSLLERNYWKGKFHARFKRRNGRVRVMVTSTSLSLFGSFYTYFQSAN
jgi:elongator complex protein 5